MKNTSYLVSSSPIIAKVIQIQAKKVGIALIKSFTGNELKNPLL